MQNGKTPLSFRYVVRNLSDYYRMIKYTSLARIFKSRLPCEIIKNISAGCGYEYCRMLKPLTTTPRLCRGVDGYLFSTNICAVQTENTRGHCG